jgi:hypothetical protein
MMPWEHAIVGYLGYSVFVRVIYRDTPTSRETLVVVFASVLPDLIDKPLAWEFGVFSSGYAIGHSIFFAVPLSIAAGLVASARGRPRYGWAFGIGYLLHLPADVLPTQLRTGRSPVHRIIWPFQPDENDGETGTTGESDDSGFAETFVENITEYALYVSQSPDSPYTWLVLGLPILGLLLWIYDGMPVGREIYLLLRRTTRIVSRFVHRE